MVTKRCGLAVGVALIFALGLVGCGHKPVHEMQTAQNMVEEARAMCPSSLHLTAAAKLISDGQALMKKYKYLEARQKFVFAHEEAKLAYQDPACVDKKCPAQAPCPCPPPNYAIHVVQKGETLRSIAKQPRYYNDPCRWREIWDANSCHIAWINDCYGVEGCYQEHLVPGTYLIIPEPYGDLEMEPIFRREHASDWDRTRKNQYK